jgi:hypothetical protein
MPLRPEDYDLDALNAAAREGRCWDLAGTTADGRRWIIGDKADADRVEPPWGSSHRRVPAGSLIVLECSSRELRVLEPGKDLVVRGERWRTGHDRWVYGKRLHVENPRVGWTEVDSKGSLDQAVSFLATLPTDDGAARRYAISERLQREPPFQFATTSWGAALIMSSGDDPQAVVTEGVSPVHVTDTWAWWSDDALTFAPALHPPLVGLEEAAAELIGSLWRKVRGTPTCGWALLARVAEVRVRELIAQGPELGQDERDTLERLRVVLVDGDERDLWVRTGYDTRGFNHDVRTRLPDAWGLDAQGLLLPTGRKPRRAPP